MEFASDSFRQYSERTTVADDEHGGDLDVEPTLGNMSYDDLWANCDWGLKLQRVSVDQMIGEMEEQAPEFDNPATLHEDIDKFLGAFFSAFVKTDLGQINCDNMGLPYEAESFRDVRNTVFKMATQQ
eukprot:TRINITY_DN6776_c0_g1_i2.p3 TRINITY_DN6776_c0_g1~~TRINITY_DN6776_c0_g1_i2.p3  ORF type:complete len:127 (+),score=16.07 TRINITY_DN6776_c0_g1_i2:1-381(+)